MRDKKEVVSSKLINLLILPIKHTETLRIKVRIIKYNNELLTFLDDPNVEPTNNLAERNLRLNVIIRKIMFGDRSDRGERNHEIIMSIIQTEIQNNIEPMKIFKSLSERSLSSFDEIPTIRSP